MSETPRGKTTVSPDVLTTIARLSALSVPGVSRLAPVSGGVVLVSVDGILDDKRFVDQALLAGGDHASGSDGDLRVAGLPSMGLLTVFPFGRPDLAVLRTLPVREAITITLPLPENPASPQ